MESIVLLTTLLTELNRGELACNEVQVEGHECRDDEGEHAGQDVSCHHEVADLVIECVWVAQCPTDDWIAGRHNQEAGHRAVE